MTTKKNGVFPSILPSLVNEVLSKYRRFDSVLSHAPTKGNYHEKVLRNILSDYLPNSFTVGEGFIINKEGNVSTQTDILVVDTLDPRSFGFKDNGFFIATNIAVASFGEVKTYCTKKEFFASLQNLLNTAKIMGQDNSARSTNFLFCYDVHASTETFVSWIDEAKNKLSIDDSVKSWNFPDYIFCLKKEALLERKNEGGGFRYWHTYDKNDSSSYMQQLIIEKLLQCVTNGCGRLRMAQGIQLLEI